MAELSKLDAARRQILAAIHLLWYFHEPLAVYSLAGNAWEICEVLIGKAGKQSLTQKIMETNGASRVELLRVLNGPRNFMKHADRDWDQTSVEPSDAEADAIVLVACLEYMMAAERSPYIFGLFFAWYAAVYRDNLGDILDGVPADVFPDLALMQRHDQLKRAREVAAIPPPSGSIIDSRNELTDNWRWVDLRKFGVNLSRLPSRE